MLDVGLVHADANGWHEGWRLATQEAPVAAVFAADGATVTLAGTHGFATLGTAGTAAAMMEADPSASRDALPPAPATAAPPPYSWTQTDTDVTICVRLPETVDKRAVNVRFARNAVRVSVRNGAVATSFDDARLLGRSKFEVGSWMLDGRTLF